MLNNDEARVLRAIKNNKSLFIFRTSINSACVDKLAEDGFVALKGGRFGSRAYSTNKGLAALLEWERLAKLEATA